MWYGRTTRLLQWVSNVFIRSPTEEIARTELEKFAQNWKLAMNRFMIEFEAINSVSLMGSYTELFTGSPKYKVITRLRHFV